MSHRGAFGAAAVCLWLVAVSGCSAGDPRVDGGSRDAGGADAGGERSDAGADSASGDHTQDAAGDVLSDDRAADVGVDTGIIDATDVTAPDATNPDVAAPEVTSPDLIPEAGDLGSDTNTADGGVDVGAEGSDRAPDGAADGGATDGGAEGPVDGGTDAGGDGTRKPSGVFGGGPFYSNADMVMPMMRASGFTTMVLWSIHVHSNGNLVLNDVLLFSNGSYVGSDATWPSKVASLKTTPTSVTRIEFSVGSAGVADFENIEALIAAQGTGPSSILYRNFAALKAAIPATDAINYDDESNFDVASTVALSIMLGEIGFKVTLCPYNNSTFWTSVYNQTNAQRAGLIDRVLLQVYAGGASNNPVTWSGYFSGHDVEVGLWSRHGTNCATGDTPASVRTKLTNWRTSIAGGWMWLLDDMLACASQYPIADYAAAINMALNP